MSNYVFWVFFGIVAGFITFTIISICGANTKEASRIPAGIEDELILISRFYNSEECFAYKGEIEGITTVHTGVIDINKFNQGRMNKCFPRSGTKYAFSLSLRVPDLDEPGELFELGPIKTLNWVGKYSPKGTIEEVFVFKDGFKYNGKLTISIKNVE
jgi:hypothetical protein